MNKTYFLIISDRIEFLKDANNFFNLTWILILKLWILVNILTNWIIKIYKWLFVFDKENFLVSRIIKLPTSMHKYHKDLEIFTKPKKQQSEKFTSQNFSSSFFWSVSALLLN